ncbi:MAG TPA: hypothetical protein VKG24_11360 [Pseudolabrys sp.]|nr:hypothetical protein [Pseudolabrys sp.]
MSRGTIWGTKPIGVRFGTKATRSAGEHLAEDQEVGGAGLRDRANQVTGNAGVTGALR